MKKIAFFTIAVGEDPIYFDSVARYFPYNKKYFGQDNDVDYYLFTDKDKVINEEIISLPCSPVLWPYIALLKNNMISDYMYKENKWDKYDYIFFIDADFVVTGYCNFFEHDFFVTHCDWNKKCNGAFYGGKSNYFKKLCDQFYNEIDTIFTKKLPLPKHLDEHYLYIFYEENKNVFYHLMLTGENTLAFYDNENLDEKLQKSGPKIFAQPYKAKGRANKTYVTDSKGNKRECIVDVNRSYIFNNYTCDFGRIIPVDQSTYRILWIKKPEIREVLNLNTLTITESDL